MKPSLFALFFFLFAFIASSAKAEFVVDNHGNKVINGGKYYILPRPHIPPLGGGLRLAKTGNETCPLSVVQSPFDVDKGLPWTISSLLKIRFITTNTTVDFFSVKGQVPSCVPLPSKWTIVDGEHGIKSVKIRGFKTTLKGRFKIQRHNIGAYKIVFCPIHGGSCRDLGISRDAHGHRLLVITNGHPLVVVFLKFESSEVYEQVIKNVLDA